MMAGKSLWGAALALPLMMPAGALAQESRSASLDMGAALVRTGAALLFILALFFLLVYLVRRFYPKAFGGLPATAGAKQQGIEIISLRNLRPKLQLVHIRVSGRDYLIAVSDDRVTTVGSWESGEGIPSETTVDTGGSAG